MGWQGLYTEAVARDKPPPTASLPLEPRGTMTHIKKAAAEIRDAGPFPMEELQMSEHVPVTWVVVADGARARILEHTRIGGGLVALAAMDHDKAHGHARDLGSDRPGRSFESVGGAHHAISPHTDYLRYEKDKFAHEIAALLERAGTAHRFDRLVLVAPPRTLGDLRAAMGAHAKAAVIGEVHKDLTHTPDRELPDHLGEVMVV